MYAMDSTSSLRDGAADKSLEMSSLLDCESVGGNSAHCGPNGRDGWRNGGFL